jgi:hypothetical protein
MDSGLEVEDQMYFYFNESILPDQICDKELGVHDLLNDLQLK